MLPEALPAVPGWLTIAVGFTATFSVAALARVAGPHGRPSALPVLAVAAACCLRSTPGAALIVGGLGWAFATGFVVNHLGELTFSHADLLLLLLSLTGCAAVCLGSGLFRVRTIHPDQSSPIEEIEEMQRG